MDTAADLSVMGGPLRDQGDFNAAADFYRRALSIRAKVAHDSLPAAERLAQT